MPFEIREYQVDAEDLSAPKVAEAIGLPAEQVFKTLVARGDKSGVLLACIPGSAELSLKALARASGNKTLELAPVKEIQSLTGYIRGGVSPIGTKKVYPVYLDLQHYSPSTACQKRQFLLQSLATVRICAYLGKQILRRWTCTIGSQPTHRIR